MTTMRERFVDVMSEAMERDDRLALVLADISVDRFAPTARRHPARVINVGIREQLLIGVAAGLALEGLRSVAHTYAPFLIERPFEQIKLDLGHQGVGAVLVSIGASYDASKEGRTHNAPGDVALLDTLPGWVVHVPGHVDEVEALLRRALAEDTRVYIRLSDRQNRSSRSATPGEFDVVREGRRGTVVAVGPMLDHTIAAAEGLDLTILYASTVRPFDGATLVRTLSEPNVTLVEPYLAGTSAGHVVQALAHVPHRLLSIGVRPVELRRYGSPAEHDRAHNLDVRGLRGELTAFFDGANCAGRLGPETALTSY